MARGPSSRARRGPGRSCLFSAGHTSGPAATATVPGRQLQRVTGSLVALRPSEQPPRHLKPSPAKPERLPCPLRAPSSASGDTGLAHGRAGILTPRGAAFCCLFHARKVEATADSCRPCSSAGTAARGQRREVGVRASGPGRRAALVRPCLPRPSPLGDAPSAGTPPCSRGHACASRKGHRKPGEGAPGSRRLRR